MLKETIKKKYVGRMEHWGFGEELQEVTDVHIRTNGFDLVAPFTSTINQPLNHPPETKNDGKFSTYFGSYVQPYKFKFGQEFYGVLVLPLSKKQAPLGWSSSGSGNNWSAPRK